MMKLTPELALMKGPTVCAVMPFSRQVMALVVVATRWVMER